MTTAVLKNRIIQATNGEFAESGFGVDSFRQFVLLASGVVRLDDSIWPAVVEFLEPGAPNPKEYSIPVTRGRIRKDLWDATLDYSSGRRYVWDANGQRAREWSEQDDELFLLPTVEESLVASWREEFAARHATGLDDLGRAHLDSWRTKGLATVALPRALRAGWNSEQKERVLRILSQWFDERKLPLPVDTVVTTERLPAAGVEDLRRVVLDCVAAMTEDELAELRLPPSAVLRAKTLRSHR